MTPELRMFVGKRDGWLCVGPRVGMPGKCHFVLEVDHVRASGGLGLRSPSTLNNLVLLCRTHHLLKTEHGKMWRPKLLEYLGW